MFTKLSDYIEQKVTVSVVFKRSQILLSGLACGPEL